MKSRNWKTKLGGF